MGENPNRPEAERLLGIAEKLLESRDLNGAKEFAILAQETEPLLEGTDQILAVVDVLISSAAENRVNNHPNWYRILQIEDPTQASTDSDLIKKQYRRLALLLHPDKNRFSFADQAFRFVLDAWEVLSTASKKSQFDRDLNLIFTKVDLNSQGKEKSNNRKKPSERMATFWTACPYCYGLHEYPRVYQEYCIRCQDCKRAFHAASIPQLPPLVPGKDEYYCCWGFFPMGFVGGKGGEAAAAAASGTDTAKFPNWMPPVFSSGQNPTVNGGVAPPAAVSPNVNTSGYPAPAASPNVNTSSFPAPAASPNVNTSSFPAPAASPNVNTSGFPALAASPNVNPSGFPAPADSPNVNVNSSGFPAPAASNVSSSGFPAPTVSSNVNSSSSFPAPAVSPHVNGGGLPTAPAVTPPPPPPPPLASASAHSVPISFDGWSGGAVKRTNEVVTVSPGVNLDGMPKKRGRGRPRKNPVQ